MLFIRNFDAYTNQRTCSTSRRSSVKFQNYGAVVADAALITGAEIGPQRLVARMFAVVCHKEGYPDNFHRGHSQVGRCQEKVYQLPSAFVPYRPLTIFMKGYAHIYQKPVKHGKLAAVRSIIEIAHGKDSTRPGSKRITQPFQRTHCRLPSSLRPRLASEFGRMMVHYQIYILSRMVLQADMKNIPRRQRLSFMDRNPSGG